MLFKCVRIFHFRQPLLPATNFNIHSLLSLRYLSRPILHTSSISIIPTAHAFIPATTFPPFIEYWPGQIFYSSDVINFHFFLHFSIHDGILTATLPNTCICQGQHLICIRSVNSVPSVWAIFPFFKTSMHTFPDQIPYQHHQKKFSRSG